MAEYLSFEEVLTELGIDEEELKRLVSQGELRGFRAGMSMKFKREDVMALAQGGAESEPTIILTDSDQEMSLGVDSSDELILDESTSDTVLNIGDIMGTEDQSEIVFSDSTEEFAISPHDSDPEAAIPTVEVPSVDDSYDLVETSSDAQLVEVGVSDSMETEQFELVDDEEDETSDVAIAPRRTASGRVSRSAKLRAMELKEKGSHTAWTVVTLVSAMILALPSMHLVARLNAVSPNYVLDFAGYFKGAFSSILLSF